MIAHKLNTCAPYILCTFDNIFEILNLDIITSTPPLYTEYLHANKHCEHSKGEIFLSGSASDMYVIESRSKLGCLFLP